MKKITIFLLAFLMFMPMCSGGLIARGGGQFTTHDELADLTKLNDQLETIYDEFNGNIDYDNIADEGLRNDNFDAGKTFATEAWNNVIRAGHFPIWSNGATSIPDDWTAEGTPSYLRHCPSTQAPSQLDDSPIFYSCRLTATGADNEGLSQTFNCYSSMTYTVSLKVKCDTGSVARVVIDDDGSMDSVTHDYTDTTWQSENDKKYFTFTTASDSEQVTIKILAKNDGDTVMFSEVQITSGRLLKGYQYGDTDADTVDGINASDTPEANKLLSLNASAEFPANVVTANSLKTTDDEVVKVLPKLLGDGSVGGGSSLEVLPGGRYAFYPQTKIYMADGGTITSHEFRLSGGTVSTNDYATNIWFEAVTQAGYSATCSAQVLYVTASGDDYYIFLLYDKTIGKIDTCWSAPDHPCYGNGNDIVKTPHPFVKYWTEPLPSNLEIILVEKDIAKQIQREKYKTGKSTYNIILDSYEISDLVEYKGDLDIADYSGNHRKLQTLNKNIKYRKLKLK
jgi:hypothetical protein